MKHHAIYSIRLEGRSGVPGTMERLTPEGYFLQPMLTAGGDSVVFWGQAPDEIGFNIWRYDLTTRQARKLTDDRAVSGHPFWNAEGTQIVFFSTLGVSEATEWDMRNQFHLHRAPRSIWIMDRDGNNRTKLTDGPHVDERPCISPDGTCVVFVSDRSGHMNLWALDPRTAAPRQVTKHEGFDYRPVFAPDGTRLAFFTNNTPQGTHELCIMSWPEGERCFPVAPGRFKWTHGPLWTSDGKSILIHAASERVDAAALWLLDVATGELEQLELQGIPSYAHGALNAAETLLIFDSHCVLELPSSH